MKKPTKKLGITLLGIWILAEGILQLTGFSNLAVTIVLGVLAVITGIVLLIGR